MMYYARKLPLLRDLVTQVFVSPEVAIVGSVHRENVGDMALSASIAYVLTSEGVRWGMQLLGEGTLGLAKWPRGQGKAIVAGGALGREARIRLLVEKYRDDPSQVAIVGISLWSENDLSESSTSFLKSVGFVSCRNRRDVKTLAGMGVDGATFAYDNAFALPTKMYAKSKKRLGINAVSRDMTWNGHEYTPTKENEVTESFGPAYARSLQQIARTYLERGWNVVHVPFTKEDERFAEWVFKDMPVALRPYNYRVEPTYRAVAQCSRFVGTRYHAHIFALKSQVPLLSFSYASKCTLLKQNLGIPDDMQATRLQVAQDENNVVERFSGETGFVLPEEQVVRIENSVRDNIRTALRAIS